MKKKLTVREKYSQHWPLVTGISMMLAVLFFISYWMVNDVLLEGYLRLVAFAFFSLGLLSLFKIKDGQVEIHLSVDEDDVLNVVYTVRDMIIYEERWSRFDLGNIKIDEMPNRSLYNDIMKSDRCIRFSRKDEHDWIYFNKVNGRVIPFSQDNAKEVYNFLKEIKK
ncbi:MAG: hypothetical protein JJU13_09985 [Balneolaceae bacterium]|nr:hypothetical protein [Balneolaceae bacterium]